MKRPVLDGTKSKVMGIFNDATLTSMAVAFLCTYRAMMGPIMLRRQVAQVRYHFLYALVSPRKNQLNSFLEKLSVVLDNVCFRTLAGNAFVFLLSFPEISGWPLLVTKQ